MGRGHVAAAAGPLSWAAANSAPVQKFHLLASAQSAKMMMGLRNTARRHPALMWARIFSAVAATSLACVSLSLCIPWVQTGVGGLSQLNFWIVGVYTLISISFVGGGLGIWFFSSPAGSNAAFQSLLTGLDAGVALIAVAHTLAILAVVYSAQALRALRGGRAYCCPCCACTCCCICCCGVPPADDGARLARARCAGNAGTGLLFATALTAAAAAAAVGVGARSYETSYGLSYSNPGVALAALAAALAGAAGAAGAAFLIALQPGDVKPTIGGGEGFPPAIQMVAGGQGGSYMVGAATGLVVMQPMMQMQPVYAAQPAQMQPVYAAQPVYGNY